MPLRKFRFLGEKLRRHPTCGRPLNHGCGRRISGHPDLLRCRNLWGSKSPARVGRYGPVGLASEMMNARKTARRRAPVRFRSGPPAVWERSPQLPPVRISCQGWKAAPPAGVVTVGGPSHGQEVLWKARTQAQRGDVGSIPALPSSGEGSRKFSFHDLLLLRRGANGAAAAGRLPELKGSPPVYG